MSGEGPASNCVWGELQSTFSSSELHFDSDIGGFRPRTPAIGNALAIADGLPGRWMRRALEREGFRILDSQAAGEESDIEIIADDSAETTSWRLKMGGAEFQCSDIGSLIAQVARSNRAV